MAVRRGAECSLGYKIEVADGEDYMAIVFDYLKDGYSLYTALNCADDEFHLSRNLVKDNCEDINCPAHSEHRYVCGSIGITLP